MDNLIRDLRFAIRGLLKRPGFSALAISVVALGAGATAGMFNVLDTMIIRSLPYDEADRIVTVWEDNAESGLERDDVAPGNFLDWRDQVTSFEKIAAVAPSTLDYVGNDRAEVIFGASVTEGFFEVMGTQMLSGRDFESGDFKTGAGGVVILSYSLWQKRFGGDPDLLGQGLELDGRMYTVVGILPSSFEPHLLPAVGDREAWVPLVLEGWEQRIRGSRWWNAVALLKPGIPLQAAQAEMDTISARMAQEYPDTNKNIRVNLVPLREHLAGNARTALLVLQGAVSLLFAIACANLIALFLARGAERQRELAVRASLGAQRTSLIRQLLMESGLVALAGGAFGIALAYWGVGLIAKLAPAEIPRLDQVSVDPRTL
ncbi:MAG: ABC transporter permease, partial [Acidobacteriota bacterium]